MNVLISADIEGVGAVFRNEHSVVGEREYARARSFMTQEVNAAVRGACDAGAKSVLVVDAHDGGVNIIPEDLDRRARLVMGSPRPLAMMEGIDRGMDAACFIGYHAMAGTVDAAIAHTFHRRIAALSFNGVRVGEIGLNALLAGYYNVPVVMLSGDEAACREASLLIPGIQTAPVKEAIGSYAGITHHPEVCQEMIYQAVSRAFQDRGSLAPVIPDSGPVTMSVSFTTASAVDRALRVPGTERTGGNTLAYTAPDYLGAFKAFVAIASFMELVTFM